MTWRLVLLFVLAALAIALIIARDTFLLRFIFGGFRCP